MCKSCWEEYGAPQIDNPAVRECAAAISKVYEFSMAGGGLHCVVDDFNIEDEHLTDEYIGRWNSSQKQESAERYCLGILKALSLDERASALGLHDGYWGA